MAHDNPYTGLSNADNLTIFAYEMGKELGGTHFWRHGPAEAVDDGD
jgi:hypothetical protein